MTIKQVKEEAKKRFDREITDEQAQTLLEKGSELTDEVLEAVAGGAPSLKDVSAVAEMDRFFRNPPRAGRIGSKKGDGTHDHRTGKRRSEEAV